MMRNFSHALAAARVFELCGHKSAAYVVCLDHESEWKFIGNLLCCCSLSAVSWSETFQSHRELLTRAQHRNYSDHPELLRVLLNWRWLDLCFDFLFSFHHHQSHNPFNLKTSLHARLFIIQKKKAECLWNERRGEKRWARRGLERMDGSLKGYEEERKIQ